MVLLRITATAFGSLLLPLSFLHGSSSPNTRIPEIFVDMVRLTQVSTINSDSIAAYRHTIFTPKLG